MDRVPSLGDDLTVPNDDGADQRVRRRPSPAASRHPQGATHPGRVARARGRGEFLAGQKPARIPIDPYRRFAFGPVENVL